MSSDERLQKVLARGGIASRRHAEELITAARVRVNGRIVTELGTRVNPRKDRIEVDGRRVVAEPLVYYFFHKPRGTVTTLTDPEGRATIAEYLRDLPARVFPVGRLDFHTSGALLLTNDGELAQALLHPRRSVAKTYVAKVRGVPTDTQLEPWQKGMELPPVGDEPGPIRLRPVDVEVLRHGPPGVDARHEEGTTWLKITLREGRNRQIHRMAEAVGLFVMRLARIAFAGITTEGLRPGELRPLTDKEITMLRATYLRPVEQAARATARARAGEEEWGEDEGGFEDAAPAPRAAGGRGPRAGAGARAGARGAEARTTGAREERRGPSPRGAREAGPARRAEPRGAREASFERGPSPRTGRTAGPKREAAPRTGRDAGPRRETAPRTGREAGPKRETEPREWRDSEPRSPRSAGAGRTAAPRTGRDAGPSRAPEPRGGRETGPARRAEPRAGREAGPGRGTAPRTGRESGPGRPASARKGREAGPERGESRGPRPGGRKR
jgi:23S rRNA pseudouridine2605 synthase